MRRQKKAKQKGLASSDLSPCYKTPTTEINETAHYRALEKLTKSAKDRKHQKKSLSHAQGSSALKVPTDRKV